MASRAADDSADFGNGLVEGGTTHDDVVAIAEAFILHGARAIDVSTGQVAKED